MTKRRQEFKNLAANYSFLPRMKMARVNHNSSIIMETYLDARVCIVIHTFAPKMGGEYLRMSEFSISGCIPVVEEIGDTIVIELYTTCGGNMFAPYESLLDTTDEILAKKLGAYDDSMRRKVNWWNNAPNWSRLLHDVFGKSTS
jgi:hypothetical protein